MSLCNWCNLLPILVWLNSRPSNWNNVTIFKALFLASPSIFRLIPSNLSWPYFHFHSNFLSPTAWYSFRALSNLLSDCTCTLSSLEDQFILPFTHKSVHDSLHFHFSISYIFHLVYLPWINLTLQISFLAILLLLLIQLTGELRESQRAWINHPSCWISLK